MTKITKINFQGSTTINPATGKPVERTSNFGLSDADWNKAYQEGLSKSAEQINLSRQRATRTGVRGPRER